MAEIMLDQPATSAAPWQRIVGVHAGSPGPTLIVVGGVHGNEPAGLLAAKRILEAFDADPPARFAGRLVVLAGNLACLNGRDRDARYVQHDLNRIVTTDTIAGTGELIEHEEARELIATIRAEQARAAGPVVLIDLHTVSADSPPFVATPDALPIRRLADALPIPRILGFEEELPGLVADYASSHMGIPAMIIEAGQHDRASSVDCHEWAIWLMLDAAGLLTLSERPASVRTTDPRTELARAAGRWSRRVYDIRFRQSIDHEDFAVEPGIAAYKRVSRHHPVIARQNGHSLTSPIAGRLFMPNLQPSFRVGDDGFFVIREVGWTWLHLSAWLRKQRWVHRALPRFVPGVRTHAGKDHELLVAPEIAAVFRRQIFHLFGYRLVRHERVPDISNAKRVALGLSGFLSSLGRIAAGIFQGGERGVLPHERPYDWIVARRPLDIKNEQN